MYVISTTKRKKYLTVLLVHMLFSSFHSVILLLLLMFQNGNSPEDTIEEAQESILSVPCSFTYLVKESCDRRT